MAPDAKEVCFVICPIGKEGSETRQRSDDLLKYVIEPAAEAAGYVAQRAIEEARPGLITERVIQSIIQAPMVVADLTDHNPNVFYELAIRHMVQKPFVQLILAGQEVPFNVFGIETIEYSLTQVRLWEQAKEKLTAQIRVAKSSPDAIRTSVSVAIDLQAGPNASESLQPTLRDVFILQQLTLDEVRRVQQAASASSRRVPPPPGPQEYRQALRDAGLTALQALAWQGLRTLPEWLQVAARVEVSKAGDITFTPHASLDVATFHLSLEELDRLVRDGQLVSEVARKLGACEEVRGGHLTPPPRCDVDLLTDV